VSVFLFLIFFVLDVEEFNEMQLEHLPVTVDFIKVAQALAIEKSKTIARFTNKKHSLFEKLLQSIQKSLTLWILFASSKVLSMMH